MELNQQKSNPNTSRQHYKAGTCLQDILANLSLFHLTILKLPATQKNIIKGSSMNEDNYQHNHFLIIVRTFFIQLN